MICPLASCSQLPFLWQQAGCRPWLTCENKALPFQYRLSEGPCMVVVAIQFTCRRFMAELLAVHNRHAALDMHHHMPHASINSSPSPTQRYSRTGCPDRRALMDVGARRPRHWSSGLFQSATPTVPLLTQLPQLAPGWPRQSVRWLQSLHWITPLKAQPTSVASPRYVRPLFIALPGLQTAPVLILKPDFEFSS